MSRKPRRHTQRKENAERKGGREGDPWDRGGFQEHPLVESGVGLGFCSQLGCFAFSRGSAVEPENKVLKTNRSKGGAGTLLQDRPQGARSRGRGLEAAFGCPPLRGLPHPVGWVLIFSCHAPGLPLPAPPSSLSVTFLVLRIPCLQQGQLRCIS